MVPALLPMLLTKLQVGTFSVYRYKKGTNGKPQGKGHGMTGKLKTVCVAGCPVERALAIMGGKWKGLILFHLIDGVKRFGELRRIMPAITQRMLTKQLRELEADGLVLREAYHEIPPRVEYSLSERGRSLEDILLQLESWSRQHLPTPG